MNGKWYVIFWAECWGRSIALASSGICRNIIWGRKRSPDICDTGSDSDMHFCNSRKKETGGTGDLWKGRYGCCCQCLDHMVLIWSTSIYIVRKYSEFCRCIFFETVSGFTTTGSSILRDVEALPQCMLFWRSFTHWIGGMGVLVFVLMLDESGQEEFHVSDACRSSGTGER